MPFSLPSFAQKLVLRYALSRLGLVDTDTLDLATLGITWGQRSTFELRNVGLKLEKLSAHLPPYCTLTKGSVSLLRVTVPANLHNSSIIVEVDGVDARVRLLPDKPEQNAPPTRSKGTAEDEGQDGHSVLPSTADLAQSFLESEPKEETEELQAAILSQSQYPEHLDAQSDDGEEDLGLYDGLSLPAFIAGFLKGVIDRLQLNIANVSLRVDTEVQRDGVLKDETQDPISGLFTIQEIAIDSTATSASEDSRLKIGKRMVSLSGIHAMIMSDAEVFSNYSRFNAPDIPSTVHSKSTHTPLRPRSPQPSSSGSDSCGDMSRSTILDPSSMYGSRLTVDSHGDESRHLESSVYSTTGRFSDADSDDENDLEFYSQATTGMLDSHYDERLLDNPAYLDEALKSQFDDHLEDSTIFPKDCPSTPVRDQTPRPHVSKSPSSSPEHYMYHSVHESNFPVGGGIRDNEPDSATSARGKTPDCQTEQESPSTSKICPAVSQPEDLSASRIFTHEEAQSMYMSAMSQSSTTSFDPDMPGAWGSSKRIDTSDPDQKEQPLSGDTDTEAKGASHDFDTSQNSPEAQTGEDDERESVHNSPQYISGVVKEILAIDRIIIWLPSVDSQDSEEIPKTDIDSKPVDPMVESTITLADSVTPDLLANTRSRLAQSAFRRGSVSSIVSSRHLPISRTKPTTQKHEDFDGLNDPQTTRAVEIDITSLTAKLDIASGWLLVKIGQRITDVSTSTSKQTKISEAASEESSPSFFRLNLTSCSLKFLERVPAQPYPLSSAPSLSQLQSGIPIEETILHLTLSGTSIDFAAIGNTTKLRLDVMKFVLGHMSYDIISFDESLRMRESTRDVTSPGQKDISLRVIKSSESTTVNLTTLPICLSLDLQELDETLGWFGGLSTVLELGSSIASASTVKGEQPCSPPRPRRGVHFADPVPPSSPSTTNHAALKANCRIGGIVLRVIGEHCTVQLGTTAAKLVSRFEGIALQIDKASVGGPHLRKEPSPSPPSLDFENIRFEYLYGPKEVDLDRLLGLLTPSKDKFDEDDDIMLDTLFRQRRQGAVLRLTVGHADFAVPNPTALQPLSHLGEELAKLATVAKYLPQDDRPGILILALVREFEGRVHVNNEAGDITIISHNLEAGYVTFPSLLATRISTVTVVRNGSEELVAEVIPEDTEEARTHDPLPMIMARFIADEMEPTVKIKLYNVRVEYTVPSITAFLGLNNQMAAEDVAANMAQSVLNLADLKAHHEPGSDLSERDSIGSGDDRSAMLPRLSVGMKDCGIGLNPRKSPAKALVIFTRASFSGALHETKPSEALLDIRKASVMIIDNVENLGSAENYRHRMSSGARSGQIQHLQSIGFVPVCDISSASVALKVMQLDVEGEKSLDIEVRDDLLVLETCADSTQTLISILSGLAPLSPPITERKYRTEVIRIEDMLNSLSGDAFATDIVPDSDYEVEGENDGQDGDGAEEIEYVSVFYPSHGDSGPQGRGATTPRFGNEGSASAGTSRILGSFHSEAQMSSSIPELEFQEDHFAKQSAVGDTAHRWDSSRNTYTLATEVKLRDSPLRIRVRDVHVIWNLYDGYDWQRTRDTISKAVRDVQAKAAEKFARRPGNRLSADFEEDEESVIGDFLFNSVYIGIPANRDPRELSHDINRNIDDLASETMSFATSTTVTGLQNQVPGTKREKLRLARSKHHKMTFELKGISADLIVFPPHSGETQSSLDIRVEDLEIFDHIPTSTWKKFATYMRDVGEREIGTSMVHLEILNVKPVPDLAASEVVLKATVLPLRLHVDQDALDFLSRFFEFKDDSAPSEPSPEDVPFLQRAEVNAIRVRLDFKPKRVDYAGLRSGRTTEFMNFFVLDEADMVLQHVIIYGVSGFDRLGRTLNDIWMPDIKANQLPTVLAGIAPVRSLVNIGGGVKDLVLVPMREYKKDGRIVRSIQKGAVQFAKTTTNELLRFGAKLAIGTQTALQSAEDFLNSPRGSPSRPSTSDGRWDDNGVDEGERPRISLYADQPLGVAQGLRGAYSSLERDILMTRDAIVAMPSEVLESGSATEAARRLLGRTPTVVLRPAIGASKAVSQTLLGVSNALDPKNRRKIDDKYKKHKV
ncbi:autophagy regulatory protein Atg2 [Coccidioides immitis RS]|uniref:Autophagy-related protein 2 n=2 Tax=Coccidioides immitis TaxID=5501 RepID=ATG2_COCIM|nr:autophagy regulatory protein Atg2 [Coccidioides immitis RS]Q1E702.1 RecName: Full=Autophagy-related protein 2 [Coccidioides immitis RS]EAS36307.3 autophagy regulatory protein Atg2 [Coccidioides immitis RS]